MAKYGPKSDCPTCDVQSQSQGEQAPPYDTIENWIYVGVRGPAEEGMDPQKG